MKKLILLILSSFSLVGCASNELADSEKESLLNEQKAIEFQKGEVKQQGFEKYNLNELFYSKNITGKNIKVAVMDTGYDIENKDISIVKGINLTSDDSSDVRDRNGHGTRIAGIIGAKKNNEGLIGIAPESDLYIYKIAYENGQIDSDILVKGIETAIKDDVDIINMSLEFSEEYPNVTQALKKASDKGIILLSSAGNRSSESIKTEVQYPGNLDIVISVSMLDVNGNISEFGVNSDDVDIYSPGEDVVGTYFGNKLTLSNDCSSATAYTSGIAALILEIDGKLSQEEMITNINKILNK